MFPFAFLGWNARAADRLFIYHARPSYVLVSVLYIYTWYQVRCTGSTRYREHIRQWRHSTRVGGWPDRTRQWCEDLEKNGK